MILAGGEILRCFSILVTVDSQQNVTTSYFCLLTMFFSFSPLYTLFLPFRCAPYSDGVSWARMPGVPRHAGIDEADELTDVDEE